MLFYELAGGMAGQDTEMAADMQRSVTAVTGYSPSDDERATVCRIVYLRQIGESYRSIAATLDAEGHRPRRAASWSAMAVRNIAEREQDAHTAGAPASPMSRPPTEPRTQGGPTSLSSLVTGVG